MEYSVPGGEGQEEAEPGEEAPEEDLGRDAHGEEQGQGQARARQEEAAVDPAAGPVLPVAEVEVGPHRRHGGHGPEEVGPAQVACRVRKTGVPASTVTRMARRVAVRSWR